MAEIFLISEGFAGLKIEKYEGQSNENGSPRITLTVRKLVTLGFAYGTNI
jgi:hypothetical protein